MVNDQAVLFESPTNDLGMVVGKEARRRQPFPDVAPVVKRNKPG